MSETQSTYLSARSLFDVIMPTERKPEDIYSAYLDLFSGPSGQIVLEDLCRELCFGQSEPGCEAREQGKHDAFLMIRFKIQQGLWLRYQNSDRSTQQGEEQLWMHP